MQSPGHTIMVDGKVSARDDAETSLLRAMGDPAFYPHGPDAVEHRETHISHLFFAGDLAYKIKKSVRYSFLDYSTLARRLFFLQEELRLNRRLAPSVYLGILPISHDDHGWQLGSDAHPVEYALVMRRLPERRMLDYLLERDQVTPRMMEAVAEILAPFHAEAANNRRVRSCGYPARIRKVWQENLADLDPFVGRSVDGATLAAIRNFGDRFLDEHSELMLGRAREGRTREVHGDLHCEHVCFAPEGIQIFDCVEFSSQLRRCDVASEVAFLLMDLEARGAKRHAQEFLARYLDLEQDFDLPKLLPFYQCYRALVRAKVFTLLFPDHTADATRYFDLAYSYTWQPSKPFVVMICGLTGTGKSTLARALSRRLGAPVINSDVTRKRLAGTLERHGTVSYGEGLYSPATTGRAYRKMTEEAEKLLAAGEAVILDATFQKAGQRAAVFAAAKKFAAQVAVVECRSSEDMARQRLVARAREGRDVSDGSWQVYLKQKEAFEPMSDSAAHRPIDTEAPVEELCKSVEQFLRAAFFRSGKNAGAVPTSDSNLLTASR